MPQKRPISSALKSLRPHESTAVRQALLKAHPELVAEADGLATGILDKTSWESVGEDVEQRLRSLPWRRSTIGRATNEAAATFTNATRLPRLCRLLWNCTWTTSHDGWRWA